jgi:hypothetical protein
LLQSLSLYAVIPAFAISMTFSMMILPYKPAPVGAEHCSPQHIVVSKPINGRFKVKKFGRDDCWIGQSTSRITLRRFIRSSARTTSFLSKYR